jgi:hypothetical protein
MSISKLNQSFLSSLFSKTKTVGLKLNEAIDAINDYTDGSQSFAQHITATTQSTSTATGAFIVDGGVGIVKDVYIGGALNIAGTSAFTGKVVVGAGTVSNPGLVVGANDNGFYEISSTQQGFSIGNALVGGFNATGLFTNVISEQTAASGVTIDSFLIKDGGFTASGNGSMGGNNILDTETICNNSVADFSASYVYLGGVESNLGFTLDRYFKATAFKLSCKTIGGEVEVPEGVTGKFAVLNDGVLFVKPSPVAINADAVASAAQIASGCITSTSAAATAITTPTATAIAAAMATSIGTVTQGTSFEFAIDNSVGANTVTLTLDGSITVVTAVVTGGDTLTVAAGTIGIFKLYFISGVAAKISRIV